MILQLDIKPFANLSDALYALKIAFAFPSKLKFKCDSNYKIAKPSIINMLTACKAFLTIEKQFKDFIKYDYHIKCVTKIFWNDNSWEVKISNFGKNVSVYSGSYLGGYNDPTTRVDEVPFVSSKMINQLYGALREAQSLWDRNAFESFNNRELKIIGPASTILRGHPGDEYGIYGGYPLI